MDTDTGMHQIQHNNNHKQFKTLHNNQQFKTLHNNNHKQSKDIKEVENKETKIS
ncbi:protein of unknown function, DUF4106 family [Trichomonas vaginalis G3]|uniref:protein of unknown function, DUF4106 family n=1 Tax=Trichomonas vaginalis (strain ATCC PRA-98 / G3) TaxID=412133 RepID=UPI0021E53636|nr:protein of unknown function, DUF4106 family [Trichomonas vaginalis G3]KAI5543587.1 protein of unknown function, DUF4106 family [Trichomonas vaginalis G3]